MTLCDKGCGVPVYVDICGDTLHEPEGRSDVYRECDKVESLAYAIHLALEGHRSIAYMPGILAEVARIAALAAAGVIVDTLIADTTATLLAVCGIDAGTMQPAQPTFAHGGPIAKGTLDSDPNCPPEGHWMDGRCTYAEDMALRDARRAARAQHMSHTPAECTCVTATQHAEQRHA